MSIKIGMQTFFMMLEYIERNVDVMRMKPCVHYYLDRCKLENNKRETMH
jgi:hypothetical protein